jgi:hypothetical protein
MILYKEHLSKLPANNNRKIISYHIETAAAKRLLGPTGAYNERFVLHRVTTRSSIKKYVESLGYTYKAGCTYYQLKKQETIRDNTLYIRIPTMHSISSTTDVPTEGHRLYIDVISSSVTRNRNKVNLDSFTRSGRFDDALVFIQSHSYTRVLEEGTYIIVDTVLAKKEEKN